MKIWLNLEDEVKPQISERVVAARITEEDYKKLRKKDKNVSDLLRRLIKAYLKQLEVERKRWVKTEGNEL